MAKLSRRELAIRADRIGLALYPLAKGGYALLERDADGNPDFARKALEQGTASQVSAFLVGAVWQAERES